MRYQKTNRYIFLAVAFVFLLFGILRGYPFSGACEPYGSVSYKGVTAPDGYEVVALIGGQQFAESKVENGRYQLSIRSDDPQTQDKEGWDDNDLITFKVNGQDAINSIIAKSGPVEVNVSVPSLGTELTTWGKIKALFR